MALASVLRWGLVFMCCCTIALGSVDWPITANEFTGGYTYQIAAKHESKDPTKQGFPSFQFGVNQKDQSLGFSGDFAGWRHVLPGYTFTWYICLNDTTGLYGNTTGCAKFPDPGCYKDSKFIWGGDATWKKSGGDPTHQLSYYNTTIGTSKPEKAQGITVVFAHGSKTPYFMRRVTMSEKGGVNEDRIQTQFDLSGQSNNYFKIPSYLTCSHSEEGFQKKF